MNLPDRRNLDRKSWCRRKKVSRVKKECDGAEGVGLGEIQREARD